MCRFVAKLGRTNGDLASVCLLRRVGCSRPRWSYLMGSISPVLQTIQNGDLAGTHFVDQPVLRLDISMDTYRSTMDGLETSHGLMNIVPSSSCERVGWP
jgi:hypothetical protein